MRVEATAPNGSPYYLFSQHCPNRFLSWLIWGSGCTPQVRLDAPIEKKFTAFKPSHQTMLASFRKAHLPDPKQVFLLSTKYLPSFQCCGFVCLLLIAWMKTVHSTAVVVSSVPYVTGGNSFLLLLFLFFYLYILLE